MPSVAATYYDGLTAKRHAVEVSLHPDGLAIFSAEGRLVSSWPYQSIRRIEGHAGAGLAVTLLPQPGSTAEPLLEIPDMAFAADLAGRAPLTLTKGLRERRERRAVVFWAIAAIISLLGLAFYGLPAIAGRLAPLVPAAAEIRLGAAMDPEIRKTFGGDNGIRTCIGAEGQQALANLVGRFEEAAGLHVPLKVVVLNHRLVNAFALPGGYVYMFNGLLQKARSPDEFAGVLAHEIGHVKLRHGLRSVIQAGGLGFLLGTVFGDFAGGTAIILASRSLMQSAFSRDSERQADHFAVDLMLKAGGDPLGLARFFINAGVADPGGLSWIASHPANAEREQAIRDALTGAAASRPALTPEQWTALRAICQKTD
ncbi:M48 family metallopeptidase [Phreatobacter stygius]|uniref:M48 family metallopeptidase n=1 Tax=Phreatobacter stygius TaxID=1940610 RepID=A0A4D7BE09_9HYPH|nr:M48 family metallopeptidase [Phreatobacter stygius]QCI66222.1 M48 family metallopeptidase [Phreatobacter stygius]